MAQFGQLFVSVANIIIAVILGVVASYIGVWLFTKSTRHLDDWGEVRRGNVGMGIVMGSIIVGIALILKPAVDLPLTGEIANPFLVLVGEMAGIVLGLFLAMSAIVFSLGVFDRLVGDIDELSELQRGNTSVAVIMAAVVLAVSYLISGAVASIIRWFTTFLGT
ncbi:MAG: DUF350 domain-containing protein [Anaerolineaceae bacterium]|nr:DUF350 domain-containing protein [Anaerolineaceae bacterium]MCB9102073.1 DUF350 domain-containing protein [Anaerolineales bacterium]